MLQTFLLQISGTHAHFIMTIDMFLSSLCMLALPIAVAVIAPNATPAEVYITNYSDNTTYMFYSITITF